MHTRFAIDYFEMNHVRLSLAATLVITTLNRLRFDTMDFGFGETQCRQRQQLFLKGNSCCCDVLARHTILYFSVSSYREHTTLVLINKSKYFIIDCFMGPMLYAYLFQRAMMEKSTKKRDLSTFISLRHTHIYI